MDLGEYQRKAKQTDQFSQNNDKVMHPLLNLTESVGILSRFIEQSLRDKALPEEYARRRISAKIGDILWYLSNVASRRGVDLNEAATENLRRIDERWGASSALRNRLFDESLPPYEQLPRKFRVAFFEPEPQTSPRKIMIALPGEGAEWIQVGDRIDDNAEEDDGYRFHDVLHLANAAQLGWSPVIRALLRRKRKSDKEADRVQDGARAVNIEEAMTAFVFSHAKQVNFFNDSDHVDFWILKSIERLTLGLEVRHRSYDQWERAILEGYRLFREIRTRGEGLITVDLEAEENARLRLDPLPPTIKQRTVPASQAE